jgi:hypothetical protein
MEGGMWAALMMAAIVVQPVQQFDLICTGNTVNGGELIPSVTTPSTIRYRIDLQRNLWCVSECRSPQAIARVTDTQLLLEESSQKDEVLEVEMSIRRSVDRMSGAYSTEISDSIRGIRGGLRSSGTCERAPFTPIPQSRF